jgi:hypothetical protein
MFLLLWLGGLGVLRWHLKARSRRQRVDRDSDRQGLRP